jgi:hypothetical protein
VRPGWFRRWFDPEWYRYLGGNHPDGTVVAVAIVVMTLLGFGGYSLAAMGGGNTTPLSSGAYVPPTTTVRTVEAYVHGRAVVKRVAVVERVAAAPVTVLQTQTIHTPAGTEVVTRPVSVYRATTVLVHGKPVTVRSVVTNTQIATQLATVTNEVTNEHTSTVVQNQTQTATVTRTATAPAQTATVTRTVTAPAQTVTVTGPTSTVTVTTQVTTPPKTVTVTVTVPTTTKGP